MKNEFSNLEKIFWPKEKLTKGDVIAFYERIAPYILPHLKDRPESLKRFPNGIHGDNFFQKNLVYHPDWVQTVEVEHTDKINNYLLIQDIDTLLYAVNLGCIEMHPFLSRYKTLDYPDFAIIDLDPYEISFDKVVEAAIALHEVLEEFDIPSYCKTSGATGMHIYIPLHAKYTYEQAKQFAGIIASLVHERIPKTTSLERLPKHRHRKVYLDYLQNNLGQTVASPYSLRAREGAPISTPLEWNEVHKGIHPLDFTLFTIEKRLQKKGDIFKPVLGKGINIEKILQKIESH